MLFKLYYSITAEGIPGCAIYFPFSADSGKVFRCENDTFPDIGSKEISYMHSYSPRAPHLLGGATWNSSFSHFLSYVKSL